MIPSSPIALSLIPKAFGILGPVTSASKIPTLKPFLFKDTAKYEVINDLPTPPLPDKTATTLLTLLRSLSLAFLNSFAQSPLDGQVSQLCVHSDINTSPSNFITPRFEHD